MRIVWLSILLAVGLASYRAVQVDAQQQEEVTPSDSIKTKQLPTRLPPKVEDSVAIQHVAHLDSIYTSTPLYFEEDGHYYFYVANGKWSKYFTTDTTLNFQLGIVDENYDTILPPAYHKLYTPNGTAKGYIEIERDGKRGLLNYRTRQVIPATYEIIFPSQTDGVVAIGRRGNDYYNLKPDGSEQMITNETQYPDYIKILQNHPFDIKDYTYLNMVYWYLSNRTPTERYYAVSYGAILPPSYLIETGFVKEWIEGVGERIGWTIFSTDEARGNVEVVKNTPWGFSLLVYDFYENGIEGRSRYNSHAKIFATVDSNSNVLGKAQVSYSSNCDPEFGCNCENSGTHFINDSMIEHVFLYYDYVSDEPEPHSYILRTYYHYHKIKKNGALVELVSNRLYAFTQYLYINEAYFKGCYVNVAERNTSNIKVPNYEDMDLYVTDHLTVDDLDLMYNEVLADYGYKFKDAKWDAYFKQKAWYKPRFDNVDHLLNDYEKANLKLIQSTRDKVANNPDQYIHGTFKNFY